MDGWKMCLNIPLLHKGARAKFFMLMLMLIVV